MKKLQRYGRKIQRFLINLGVIAFFLGLIGLAVFTIAIFGLAINQVPVDSATLSAEGYSWGTMAGGFFLFVLCGGMTTPIEEPETTQYYHGIT